MYINSRRTSSVLLNLIFQKNSSLFIFHKRYFLMKINNVRYTTAGLVRCAPNVHFCSVDTKPAAIISLRMHTAERYDSQGCWRGNLGNPSERGTTTTCRISAQSDFFPPNGNFWTKFPGLLYNYLTRVLFSLLTLVRKNDSHKNLFYRNPLVCSTLLICYANLNYCENWFNVRFKFIVKFNN